MTPEIKAYIDDQLGRLRQALRTRAIYTKHGIEHLRGGRDFVPMLTVEEQDGSPTVAGVRKIKVTNATLTNDGDGVVSLAIASGTSAHDHTTADGSGVLTNYEADGYGQYAEIAAPTTPSAGKVRIYPKADGLMYVKDDAGTEREMGAVAHAAAPDPHTEYVLESLIDAAGDLLYGSADNTPARLAIGTAAYKLHVASGLPAWTKDYVPILVIIDGGVATITTGVKGDIPLLENLTIEGWTVLADQSGSIVIDVWMDTYANYAPTVADTIAGTEKPTITTATKGQDVSLSSWDATLDAGSTLRFNVDSVTSIQRATVLLHCFRR